MKKFEEIQSQVLINSKLINTIKDLGFLHLILCLLTGNYSVYGFQIKLSRSLGPFLLSVGSNNDDHKFSRSNRFV